MFEGQLIKTIYKAFSKSFMALYKSFYDFAKQNYSNQSLSLIKVHEIMKDLEKLLSLWVVCISKWNE